jgi:hypothetical protein
MERFVGPTRQRRSQRRSTRLHKSTSIDIPAMSQSSSSTSATTTTTNSNSTNSTTRCSPSSAVEQLKHQYARQNGGCETPPVVSKKRAKPDFEESATTRHALARGASRLVLLGEDPYGDHPYIPKSVPTTLNLKLARTVIGRDPNRCHIVVDSEKYVGTLSRAHCAIVRHQQMTHDSKGGTVQWWLEDLCSTNGTFVNGIALRSTSCHLQHGDVVTLGTNDRNAAELKDGEWWEVERWSDTVFRFECVEEHEEQRCVQQQRHHQHQHHHQHQQLQLQQQHSKQHHQQKEEKDDDLCQRQSSTPSPTSPSSLSSVDSTAYDSDDIVPSQPVSPHAVVSSSSLMLRRPNNGSMPVVDVSLGSRMSAVPRQQRSSLHLSELSGGDDRANGSPKKRRRTQLTTAPINTSINTSMNEGSSTPHATGGDYHPLLNASGSRLERRVPGPRREAFEALRKRTSFQSAMSSFTSSLSTSSSSSSNSTNSSNSITKPITTAQSSPVLSSSVMLRRAFTSTPVSKLTPHSPTASINQTATCQWKSNATPEHMAMHSASPTTTMDSDSSRSEFSSESSPKSPESPPMMMQRRPPLLMASPPPRMVSGTKAVPSPLKKEHILATSAISLNDDSKNSKSVIQEMQAEGGKNVMMVVEDEVESDIPSCSEEYVPVGMDHLSKHPLESATLVCVTAGTLPLLDPSCAMWGRQRRMRWEQKAHREGKKMYVKVNGQLGKGGSALVFKGSIVSDPSPLRSSSRSKVRRSTRIGRKRCSTNEQRDSISSVSTSAGASAGVSVNSSNIGGGGNDNDYMSEEDSASSFDSDDSSHDDSGNDSGCDSSDNDLVDEDDSDGDGDGDGGEAVVVASNRLQYLRPLSSRRSGVSFHTASTQSKRKGGTKSTDASVSSRMPSTSTTSTTSLSLSNPDEDAWIGTQVAVKVVTRNDASSISAFWTELEALVSLSGDPRITEGGHVVRLLGVCFDREYVVAVISYHRGGPLSKWWKRHRKLNRGKKVGEVAVARVLRGVGRALKICHQSGRLHLDVKENNVVFDCGVGDVDHVVLIDFGCAVSVAETNGVIVDTGYDDYFEGGTFCCMAPEVLSIAVRALRHERLHESASSPCFGAKADVWSLGIMAHVLLTGRYPYGLTGERSDDIEAYELLQRMMVTDKPWDGARDRKQLSIKAQQFLRRLLTIDVERRPSLDEVMSDPFITENTKK